MNFFTVVVLALSKISECYVVNTAITMPVISKDMAHAGIMNAIGLVVADYLALMYPSNEIQMGNQAKEAELHNAQVHLRNTVQMGNQTKEAELNNAQVHLRNAVQMGNQAELHTAQVHLEDLKNKTLEAKLNQYIINVHPGDDDYNEEDEIAYENYAKAYREYSAAKYEFEKAFPLHAASQKASELAITKANQQAASNKEIDEMILIIARKRDARHNYYIAKDTAQNDANAENVAKEEAAREHYKDSMIKLSDIESKFGENFVSDTFRTYIRSKKENEKSAGQVANN